MLYGRHQSAGRGSGIGGGLIRPSPLPHGSAHAALLIHRFLSLFRSKRQLLEGMPHPPDP